MTWCVAWRTFVRFSSIWTKWDWKAKRNADDLGNEMCVRVCVAAWGGECGGKKLRDWGEYKMNDEMDDKEDGWRTWNSKKYHTWSWHCLYSIPGCSHSLLAASSRHYRASYHRTHWPFPLRWAFGGRWYTSHLICYCNVQKIRDTNEWELEKKENSGNDFIIKCEASNFFMSIFPIWTLTDFTIYH